MSDLHTSFTQAQEDVKHLSKRPDNDTLLRLYALFKQATQGDVQGEPPSSFDFVARAKFDAWSALKGITEEESMKQYVELVKTLRHPAPASRS